jgi:hypothetical protein
MTIYDPNVPLPRDSLADSQRDFNNNFISLFNTFNRNHVPINTASIAGNHTVVDLLVQGKAPVTNVGEISVYSKNSSPDPSFIQNNLFLKYQSGQEIAITAYQLYSIDSANPPNRFITFLPGKILVYFGSVVLTSQNTSFDLTPAISKKIMSVNITRDGTNLTFMPWVSLQQNNDGFYHRVVLNQFILTSNLSGKVNYIVLANL